MNSTNYTDTNQLNAILDSSIGVSTYYYWTFFDKVTVRYYQVLDAFFHYESLAIINKNAFVIINTASIIK